MPEKSEIRFRYDKIHGSLELIVPQGLSHKELGKITLGELLSKFRPSGCPSCLSGQPFILKEKFERVLPVDISAGKFNIG